MDIQMLILQNYIVDSINMQQSLLDELVKKNSPRKELIEQLSVGVKNLKLSYLKFKELDSEFRQTNRRNFDLEAICMRQQVEINQLKEQNKNLMEGL